MAGRDLGNRPKWCPSSHRHCRRDLFAPLCNSLSPMRKCIRRARRHPRHRIARCGGGERAVAKVHPQQRGAQVLPGQRPPHDPLDVAAHGGQARAAGRGAELPSAAAAPVSRRRLGCRVGSPMQIAMATAIETAGAVPRSRCLVALAAPLWAFCSDISMGHPLRSAAECQGAGRGRLVPKHAARGERCIRV